MAAKKKSVDFKQFTYSKLTDSCGGDREGAVDGNPEASESVREDSEETEVPTRSEFRQWFRELRLDFLAHQTEMRSLMSEIREDISELGQRVETLENGADAHADEMAGLEEKYNVLQKDTGELKAKLADIENRSRRNNLRFRGFPEGDDYADCAAVVTRFCHHLLSAEGTTTESSVIKLDRAHRLLGQRANNKSRDVIVCFHDFTQKDKIFQIARKQLVWKWESLEIAVFQDLSNATLQNRWELKETAAFLRNHNWKYRWLHPFGLLVSIEGVSHRISTVTEAVSILGTRGFRSTKGAEAVHRSGPIKRTGQKWQRVGSKSSRLRRQSDEPSVIPTSS